MAKSKKLSLKEIEFAELKMAGKSLPEICRAAGLDTVVAANMWRSDAINAWIAEEMNQHVKAEAAKATDALKAIAADPSGIVVSPEWMIQKYVEVVNDPDPKTGQIVIRALDSLRDMLGYGPTKALGDAKPADEPTGPLPPDVFQADWLRPKGNKVQ